MKQAFDSEKIAGEVQSLIQHAEELLRATADSASDSAKQARERAEESLSVMRARVVGVQDEVKRHARAVDDYVQENPWTAVAIAGGIALSVGLIMARK